MNSYVNYLIEANIGLVFFLAAYSLILRHETDFRVQRIFLLVGILASLVFPFFHVAGPASRIPSLGQLLPSYLLPEITIGDQGANAVSPSVQKNELTIGLFLQILYASGLVFFLFRFLIQLFQLIKKMRTSSVSSVGRYRVVESPDHNHTFSFFNFIFMGQADVLSHAEKQKIIQHESVHARQKHSVDVLLLNVISIFFWFNPILKVYKNIFIQLHEFEADARAVENRDVNEYCSLLAKVALQSADFRLASHFNNSLTLKRIQMMRTLKQKIKPWKMVAVASVIPIVFFIVACQDQVMDDMAAIAKSSTMALDIPQEVQQKYDELRQTNPEKKYLLIETDESLVPKLDHMKTKLAGLDQSQISHINLITPTAKPSEPIRTFAIVEYNEYLSEIQNHSKLEGDVFTIVDDTAMPDGGLPEFYNHIGKNLKYPLQARQKGIEGKVFVEFIVDIDGTIEVTGTSGLGAGCDVEAMRVIQSSPKWIPGKNKGVAVKQRMVLPVNFSLGGSDRTDVSETPNDAMDEMVVVGHKPN